MSITKSEFTDRLAEKTGLSRRDAGAVLAALAEIVKEELELEGEVTVPGITKLKAKIKPARKTRIGINPFTKQEQVFRSKPASVGVKSTAVKSIRDVVS